MITKERREFVTYMLTTPDAKPTQAYRATHECKGVSDSAVRARASRIWKDPAVQEFVQEVNDQSVILSAMTVDRIVFDMYEAFIIGKENREPAPMVSAMKAIASLLGKDKGQNQATDSVAALASALMAHSSNDSLPSPDEIIEDAEYYDVTN